MGKTRGHGSRRPGRGRGRGRGDGSDEDEHEPQRLGGQSSNVGMLPPSDSEEDEEAGEEGADKAKEAKEAKPAAAAKPAGQPKTAGQLPPSDSDEDEDEGSEEEESSEEPMPEYLTQPAAPRRKKQEEDEPDPEQIRKDMERLEMIKQKREADRLKRIKEEGWDRFAPVSETNKPPGHLPPDHPSLKQSS